MPDPRVDLLHQQKTLFAHRPVFGTVLTQPLSGIEISFFVMAVMLNVV